MASLRVRHLSLERYGAFTDTSFALGDGLTVVAGANEAGKSTALDALADLLWGIPHSSERSYLYARPALIVGAHLRLPAAGDDLDVDLDVHLDVVRRSTGLLHRDSGEPIEPSWIGPGDGRKQWLASYGLSRGVLQRAGKQLHDGGGDLAHLVYTARSGTSVRDTLDRLQRTADTLYKENKNSRSVTVRAAASALEVALADVEAATAGADDVEAARTTHLRAREAAQLAHHQLREAASALRVAERRLRAAPLVADVVELTSRRSVLVASGPLPTAEQVALARDALQRLDRADADLASCEAALQALTAERADIVVDEQLLSRADGVVAWQREAPSRLADAHRAAQLQAQVEAYQREAASLLLALQPTLAIGSTSPPPSLASLREGLTSVGVGADIAGQLDALAGQVVAAAGAATAAREVVRAAAARLDAVDRPRDDLAGQAVAAVAEALAAVRAEGSATQASVKVAAEVARARAERDEHLAAAGLPTDCTPTPPALASVREADDRRRVARSALAQARQQADRTDRAVTAAAGELSEATAAGPLQGPAPAVDISLDISLDASPAPDDPLDEESALRAARAARDAAAHALASAALDGASTGHLVALLTRLTETTTRADDLADHLADHLVRNAAVFARRRELARSLARLRADHTDALAALNAAEREADVAALAWHELWTHAWHGARSDPTDGEDPIQLHDRLLASRTAAAVVTAGVEHHDALQPQVAAQRTSLAAALALTGRPRADADLDALLAAAEAVLADADAAREGRATWLQVRRQHEDAARESFRVDADLSDAQERWSVLVSAAKLPAGLEAGGWAHRRETLGHVGELLERAEESAREVDDAGARVEGFLAAVAAVTGEAAGAPDPPEQPASGSHDRGAALNRVERAAGLLDELATSVGQAHMAAARATSVEERLAEAHLSRRRHQDARSQASGVLVTLRRDLAVTEDDQLEAALQRGSDATVVDTDLARLVEVLAATAGDADVEALVTDLTDADLGLLRLDLEQAQTLLEAAEQTHAESLAAVGEARRSEEELTSAPGGAQVKARASEHLAQVSDAVEQYLVTTIQLRVLREELDAYERHHSSPLLAASGALLAELTAGRYVALDIADRASGRGLVVLDAEESRFAPEDLSEGTCDQVYLALRLAGIDSLQADRVSAGLPTLPVVLDDVLMSFDDDRARAALSVMAAMSLRWQVVVLTHHHHLADLADALGSPQVSTTRLDPPPARFGGVPGERVRDGVTAVSGGTSLQLPRGAALDASDIRAWAREQGITVNEKGRLPAEVNAAYARAHAG